MQYTHNDIVALHKKYAASDVVYDLVFTHSCIVRDIALQLLDTNRYGVGLDRKLVEIGALLHDIGVYRLFEANGKLREGVSYITHGVEGERILREEGFSKKYMALCSTSHRSWPIEARCY